MNFKLEWLDEEARKQNDINRNSWVVDKERDIAMWTIGKHWQQRAEGDYSETVMLKVQDKTYQFDLMPGKNFRHYIEGEVHEYIWEEIIRYFPDDLNGNNPDEIIEILKEALKVYGGGWYENNKYHPEFTVSFNF